MKSAPSVAVGLGLRVLVLAAGALAWGLALTPAAHASVVGYWKLDDDISDATGKNPSPTFDPEGGGGPVFDAGVHGQGLDALSGQGFINTGFAFADAGQKTLVFYAKTDSFSTDGLWAGNEASTTNRFYLGTRTGNAFIGAGLGGDTSTGWLSTDTAVFHHYALVDLGDSRVRVYQDGQPVTTWTYSGSTATHAGRDFEIGRAGGGGSIPARAILDDVAVFDNTLTGNAIGLIAQDGVQAYLNSMTGKLLYRETFPHDGNPQENRTMPAEGWQAHYLDGYLSGTTVIAREEGARALPPWNSSPDQDDLLHGYVYRSATGMDSLYWTDEHTIGDVEDVTMVRWHQRNSSDNDEFQVALRLDTGTPGDTSDDQWFASIETFTNLTALEHYTNGQPTVWRLNRLLMDGAEWQSLDFVLNTSLELVPGVVPLPTGVAVTAFGLYTPNVGDAQRFDNFELLGVPEPSSLLLLVLGGLALLVARRRK